MPILSSRQFWVLVEVDVHTSGIQPGFLLLCAVPVVHPHQVATRRERIATTVLAADHVTVRLASGCRRLRRVAMVASGLSVRVAPGRVRAPAVPEGGADGNRQEQNRQ